TTIIEYRNERRIMMAKKMLISTGKRISAIAAECGFSNASYFSETFMRSEHISPSEYRKYHKY
ncbi:MAG: helix-turn-helix domain-containing protein, partial [Clostridia bacterium]|nr:helix-turn-helix domain-containing protein [Clostridia bacterium]